MKKVAFYVSQFSIRGTEKAIYKYAYYNEKLLGNKSYVVYFSFYRYTRDHTGLFSFSEEVYNNFKDRFILLEATNKEDLQAKLKENDIEYFYNLKSGENDNFILEGVININHCVFTCNELNKHGDIYLPISPAVNNKLPFIPHIVETDIEVECSDFRKELDIPENALVFGRYGGHDTFNITFVQEIVVKVALENPSIYFIFMNTPVFTSLQLKNIIHFSGSTNDIVKERFILTCDAMLHARIEGESFGLSILEFAVHKKPIITFNPLFAKITHDYHLQFLGNNGYYYQDSLSLENLLLNFNPNPLFTENVYLRIKAELNPQTVMNRFNTLFLQSC